MQYKIEVMFRWLARIISSLVVIYFLFMVIGESISNLEPFTLEGVLVVGFSIVFLINIIYAWINEEVGGNILILISIGFALFIYFSAGSHRILSSLLISSPFLLSGIFFLIASRYKKHRILNQ